MQAIKKKKIRPFEAEEDMKVTPRNMQDAN